jgi:glutathione synthase/RimK-type ligase-like ATP-grasp enzyme
MTQTSSSSGAAKPTETSSAASNRDQTASPPGDSDESSPNWRTDPAKGEPPTRKPAKKSEAKSPTKSTALMRIPQPQGKDDMSAKAVSDSATVIVVDNPKDFQLDVPNVQVMSARTYLSDVGVAARKRLKVFNLCKSYRYQSVGYYVSLLAEARGHRPLPSVATIQDMKLQTLIRLTSEELDELIQKTLATVPGSEAELHIYFGRSVYSMYDKLALQLFNLFQAPFLRADFVKRDDTWELQAIGPIATSDIPAHEIPHVVGFCREHFSGRARRTSTKEKTPRYELAILYDAKEKMSPSDEKAIKRIIRAAEDVDLGVEVVTKDDYARIGEFDALLIRETTAVHHHTYRFARRAAAEGLVVIDDPQSILRCTNKVYLAELLQRAQIPIPKTLVVHDDNTHLVQKTLGLPCVLKQPDSSFSQGVVRIDTAEKLTTAIEDYLEKSELIIAQEYIPTEFDWRVGVLDKKPLFICKYFMARRHWQIVKSDSGDVNFGRVQCVPVEEAPPELVRVAVAAANLIGDGLYGVDVKQLGDKFVVIEINDNPNIDAGYEDSVLKDNLYTRLIDVFVRRLEARTDRATASR